MKNIALFFCGILGACSSSQIQILPTETDRIVKTLSSDQMNGRGSFSSDADRAADFIAQEFANAKLTPFGTDFKQKFEIQRSSLQSLTVSLNKTELSAEDVFVISNEPQLSVYKENLKVDFIKSEDDFRKKLQVIRQSGDLEKTTVVLVKSTHRSIFERFKSFYDKSAPIFANAPKQPSFIFILSEQENIADFSAFANQEIQKIPLSNVVAKVEGKSLKDEYVVFSGHYDHIGILENKNGDSIANGANDDASGTTAVIQLANYFSKAKNNERTLLFVAYAAEENGMFGSKYFSENINPDQVVANINIEMIGIPYEQKAQVAYLTGEKESDLITILQKNLQGTDYQLIGDPYPKLNLFQRSDNISLARFGVPAHTFSTYTDTDQTYHSVDDEYENLDIKHLQKSIEAIAKSVQSLVNGKDKPSRVKLPKN